VNGMARSALPGLLTAVLGAAVSAASPTEPALWLQWRAGESEQIADVNVLVPLHATDSRVWLLNPRYSADDHSEEEAGIGLVYRRLLAGYPVIFGANIFYDSRWTRRDSHFSQLGLGLELLSSLLDFRANYYLPEHKEEKVDSYYQQEVSTRTRTIWSDPYARGHQIRQKGWRITESTIVTRLFERYEQAREGYDWELALRLPLPDPRLQVRACAGYFHWDPEYVGERELSGPKARLEVRFQPAFYLDILWFEDEHLEGSRWLAGVRLRLNCDLGALARGENPFHDSFRTPPADLRSRLYEMVLRDPKIRLADSGYREDPQARTTTVTVTRRRVHHTLLDDVNFVHGDNPGPQDGTAEHPYTTIQTAVDRAFGDRNVYVYAASTPYRENVTLRNGTTLIGEGHPLRARGGKVFGGRRRPTLDGCGRGPAVRMADASTVCGMHIINTDTGGPALRDPVYNILGYEAFGVYAGNATGFRIEDNLVESCGRGLVLVCNADRDFALTVRDNIIRNTDEPGTLIMGEGPGRSSTVVFSGNRLLNNDGGAFRLQLSDYRNVTIELADSSFEGSSDAGAWLEIQDTGDTALNLTDLEIHSHFAEGMAVMGQSTGDVALTLAGITTTSNGADGLTVDLFAGGSLTLNGQGIRAEANAGDGAAIQATAVGESWAALDDIACTGNRGAGLIAATLSLGDQSWLSVGFSPPEARYWHARLQETGPFPAELLEAPAPMAPALHLTANGRGADLSSMAAGRSVLLVQDLASLNNTGTAVAAAGRSVAGETIVSLVRVRARGGADGSSLSLDADTSARAFVASSRFEQSGSGGLAWDLSGSEACLDVRDSVFAANAGSGLALDGAVGGGTLDFGGGPAGSPGRNSIHGNGGIGLSNGLAGVSASIRHNYWGGGPPVPGTDYVGAEDPGSDWLSQDPHP